MNTTGLTFQTDSEIVVMEYSAEHADYDNPMGALHGVACYLAAFNEHGDRVRCHVKTVLQYDAVRLLASLERQAAALQARFAAGKLPVAFAQWEQARPVYGSDAYVEYGQADDLAWEAREAADEAWR